MGHRAGEVSGGGGADRRGARRTPATGRVTLSRDGGAQAVHGTIENLSRGGVLVAVHGEPAALTPERVCEVELLLVGRAPVWARAHPVRREPAPGGVLVALAFAEVSAPGVDVIEAELAAMHAAAVRRPVLVVDDDPARREAIGDALRARGMTSLAPRTPLDAIQLLSRAQLHIPVALIASRFGSIPGAELERFLQGTFPWVEQVAITGDGAVVVAVTRAAQIWARTSHRIEVTAGAPGR